MHDRHNGGHLQIPHLIHAIYFFRLKHYVKISSVHGIPNCPNFEKF